MGHAWLMHVFHMHGMHAVLPVIIWRIYGACQMRPYPQFWLLCSPAGDRLVREDLEGCLVVSLVRETPLFVPVLQLFEFSSELIVEHGTWNHNNDELWHNSSWQPCMTKRKHRKRCQKSGWRCRKSALSIAADSMAAAVIDRPLFLHRYPLF